MGGYFEKSNELILRLRCADVSADPSTGVDVATHELAPALAIYSLPEFPVGLDDCTCWKDHFSGK